VNTTVKARLLGFNDFHGQLWWWRGSSGSSTKSASWPPAVSS